MSWHGTISHGRKHKKGKKPPDRMLRAIGLIGLYLRDIVLSSTGIETDWRFTLHAVPPGDAGPTTESIRTELEKVLESRSFAEAERLRGFLRFTVEQTLGGRS